jgi:serine phosphatase RsbU (regulator of sigma subunit)
MSWWWEEVWLKGNVDAMDEFMAPNYVDHPNLPGLSPGPEGMKQALSTYYEPAREVGGDFYDFLKLEDGRVGLLVGDATGKGMPAALVMATNRGMLRAVVQSVESPGDVLARVNDALLSDIPPTMFVTCLYAILETKSGSLRYANAGHDLPYLRHHGGGDAEELRARGLPLGLMPNMPYEEKEAVLAPGDNALLHEREPLLLL